MRYLTHSLRTKSQLSKARSLGRIWGYRTIAAIGSTASRGLSGVGSRSDSPSPKSPTSTTISARTSFYPADLPKPDFLEGEST